MEKVKPRYCAHIGGQGGDSKEPGRDERDERDEWDEWRKWFPVLNLDPNLNPNLNLHREGKRRLRLGFRLGLGEDIQESERYKGGSRLFVIGGGHRPPLQVSMSGLTGGAKTVLISADIV